MGHCDVDGYNGQAGTEHINVLFESVTFFTKSSDIIDNDSDFR